MSEQEDFEEWWKTESYISKESYYRCWQASADRKDKIIEQQAAELAALREGLLALINVAERCDSWESFPSNALDAAYKVLEGSK